MKILLVILHCNVILIKKIAASFMDDPKVSQQIGNIHMQNTCLIKGNSSHNDVVLAIFYLSSVVLSPHFPEVKPTAENATRSGGNLLFLPSSGHFSEE